MKKISLLLFIISIGLIGFNAKSQTNSHESKNEVIPDSVAIKTFWFWFKKNEKSLKEFQKDPDKILSEILDAVMEINPGLIVELEPPIKGIISFTISANGDSDLLPIVKKTIQHAPKLRGWDFIAYRQQIPIEQIKTKIIEIGKNKYNPNDLKFKTFEEDGKLDLVIYGKNISKSNYNDISNQFSILVDQIMGEYNCTTQIGQIEYMELPKDKKELTELKPLLELEEHVSLFYKKRK